MREIKFKGKLSHSKQWVIGNLVIAQDGNPYIIPFNVFEPDGHHLRIDSDEPYWVDICTLSQFTGLKDKNGVEIYEGDIFRIHEGTNDFKETYLKWDNDWLLFVPSNDDLRHRIQSKHSEHYEIIGNIHDKDAENGNK